MVSPKECLFCRIVSGEIPAKKVYEDSAVVAFLDINPRNPGHTLVVPKKHYETIFDIPEFEGGKLFAALKKTATMVKNGTKAHGIAVCQNNGSAAGQVVAHLHFHVIPRFLNEGPSALEALLPVKKMDEKGLEKVAQVIKGSSSVPQEAEEFEEEERESEEERKKSPAAKPKAKAKKPESEEDEDDTDEFEQISFNL